MNEKYWFARGYYDGRTVGMMTEDLDIFPDYLRLAYKQGYDAGVTDYCADIDSIQEENIDIEIDDISHINE